MNFDEFINEIASIFKIAFIELMKDNPEEPSFVDEILNEKLKQILDDEAATYKMIYENINTDAEMTTFFNNFSDNVKKKKENFYFKMNNNYNNWYDIEKTYIEFMNIFFHNTSQYKKDFYLLNYRQKQISYNKIRTCPYCKKIATEINYTGDEDDEGLLELEKLYYICRECGVEWNRSWTKPIGLDLSKARIVNSKRNCCECGEDISNQPNHHYLCRPCWESKYIRHNQYFNKLNEVTNNNYNTNYHNYDKPERLRDALEADEDAYYNLFGEFPSDEDW